MPHLAGAALVDTSWHGRGFRWRFPMLAGYEYSLRLVDSDPKVPHPQVFLAYDEQHGSICNTSVVVKSEWASQPLAPVDTMPDFATL
jgi:hypothetical protein